MACAPAARALPTLLTSRPRPQPDDAKPSRGNARL
eukprot:CAMPEP_0197879588 /NCGR_PEP_ID=MMETSP1439-20131203/7643_1 /TAXON_ID=66791 /ORGANISM="Gonyaulax spinifera, Strain CCMP409" /LENGTH=34 /DNA_ID= /DNA_START= /DNA_END= /DNA_ORIENTATION=